MKINYDRLCYGYPLSHLIKPSKYLKDGHFKLFGNVLFSQYFSWNWYFALLRFDCKRVALGGLNSFWSFFNSAVYISIPPKFLFICCFFFTSSILCILGLLITLFCFNLHVEEVGWNDVQCFCCFMDWSDQVPWTTPKHTTSSGYLFLCSGNSCLDLCICNNIRGRCKLSMLLSCKNIRVLELGNFMHYQILIFHYCKRNVDFLHSRLGCL